MVGLKQEHAEAITASMREAVTGGVATKADIQVLKTNIHWMQAIGGFILAIMVAPLLKELLS